ncbi:ATPase family associated with various cellular activities (AAA) [Blastococcus sp. DSM 46786]|uniref:DUF5925 domain-containing protein n=1 Tax=Blastococcus sp. DSM 46786 TaxID=1798227 RepID=UPI0008B61A87|nr:DUF5925 domain-containing protein [Blastococcus sp. DSM 46786]SEL61602.1 ATPase family associated with various cellular activities (AAA) [Blastococcus sp. DSM 46786]
MGDDGLDAHYWLSYLSEVGTGLLVRAQWEGMRYARDAEVAGAVADPPALLPEGAEIRLDQQLGDQRTVVAAWGGVLARIDGGGQVTEIDVVGRERAEVEAAVALLADGARRAATLPEGSVRMRFWAERDGEGSMTTRRVEAPAWEEVAGNYTARTAAALDGLVALRSPATRAGRLLLWHGAPGTGKTTAARALGRAWAGWCQTHYVMDPERLFDGPQYLLDVAGASADRDDGKWRLVIAEDCDEYLRSDAKLRAGASLGRLLNLCDGILGHGLRVLVLLTTNEDVGRLHPAITRPGRCLSQVAFEPLTAAEARRWLGSGATAPEGPMTLAELYAVREDRAQDPAHREEPGGYL